MSRSRTRARERSAAGPRPEPRAPAADRMALGLLVALLVATPWPLGARLPWAGMLAAAAAIGGCTLWWLAALLRGRPLRGHRVLWPAVAFLALGAGQWLTGATVYAHASAVEWIRYASYALVLATTLQLATDVEAARRLRDALVWTGLAVGLFGLVQFLTWNGLLYWVWEPPFAGTRFGPFNNRNYFAGYMVVVLAPALALALLDRHHRQRAMVGYLATIGALTTLISLSRGGAVALAAVVGVLLVARMARSARGGAADLRVRVALVAAVLLVVIVGLAWLNQSERVYRRLETLLQFGQEASLTGRTMIWQGTLAMIAERPLLGWGLNTFGWVYPRFHLDPGSLIAMHAHDEYLETIAETGALGGLFAGIFLGLLLLEGWRRVRAAATGPSAEYALRLGAWCAWLGTAIYALTDFPTIIPAIDYALVVLAGLLLAERTTRGGVGPATPRA